MPLRTYFVSLDFGTYASGFAFAALTGDVVLTWDYPEAPKSYPKAITVLLYEKLARGIFGKPIAWGWEARDQFMDMTDAEREQHVYVENFKLALAPANHEYVGAYKEQKGLSGDKLIADFVTELTGMARSKLTDRQACMDCQVFALNMV